VDSTTFAGDLDNLDDIRACVTKACDAAGVDKKAAYKMILAVDELATNSISYGYERNGMTGDVIIHTDITDKELIVMIDDTAPEFDPREANMPSLEDLEKPLDERPIGGLGVFLAIKGVDRFDYQRVDNKINRVILALNRNQGE
jgi:serine/threonine-protein kinase RsbW